MTLPAIGFTISLCLFTTAAAFAGSPSQAIPVDQPPFSAELLSADAQWKMTFRADDKVHSLAAGDLVVWGAPREPKHRVRVFATDFPPAQVILPHGGVLLGDVLGSRRDRLLLDSPLLGELAIPLENVAGILFSPPIDKSRRDALARRVAEEAADSDRLILENGDVLRGRVLRFAPADAADDKTPGPAIELDDGAAPLMVKADRVAAVAFNPKLVQRPVLKGLRAVVGLADGSRFIATKLEVSGDEVKSRLPHGADWKTRRGQLVFVQPLGGRATYVSDLEPAKYSHIPFLSLKWDYQRDRNVLGSHLRCGGRLYVKGIGMHSAARLTYTFTSPYRRFQAQAALDEAAGGGGSVNFAVQVYGKKDGKVAVIRQYKSPIVRGDSPPQDISLDLTGAVGINLIVLFAERGDELDHANWLNARLVK